MMYSVIDNPSNQAQKFTVIENIPLYYSFGNILVDSDGNTWSLLEFETYEKFGLDVKDNSSFVRHIIVGNRVDILSQCKEHDVVLNKNEIINTACYNGNIDVLDWIHQEYGQVHIAASLLWRITNPKVLDWLAIHGKPEDSDSFTFSAGSYLQSCTILAKMETFEWWRKFCEKNDLVGEFNKCVKSFICNPEIAEHVLDYLILHEIVIQPDVIRSVIKNTFHDLSRILKKLYTYCMQYNIRFDASASLERGFFCVSIDVIKWVMEMCYSGEINESYFSFKEIHVITHTSGYTEENMLTVCNLWLNFLEYNRKTWDECLIVISDVSWYGYTNVLNWFYEMHLDQRLKISCSYQIINTAFNRRKIATLDWWENMEMIGAYPFLWDGTFPAMDSEWREICDWWIRYAVTCNKLPNEINIRYMNIDGITEKINWIIDVHTTYRVKFVFYHKIVDTFSIIGKIEALDKLLGLHLMYGFNFNYSENAMSRAADCKVLDWWVRARDLHGLKLTYSKLWCEKKDLDILEWWKCAVELHDIPLVYNKSIIPESIRRRTNITILNWWLQSGIPLTIDKDEIGDLIVLTPEYRSWWNGIKDTL